MPQLGENYQPSVQGKVSAATAASIVGVGAYASYKSSLPKPAQTPVKVPISGNAPPRSASPFANSYTSYSAKAKASVTVQNLESSFRMRSPASGLWRGGTGRIAAPIIGYGLGEVLKPHIIPPLLEAGARWSRQMGGISRREEQMLQAAIRSKKVNNISEAVAFIERQRSYQPKLKQKPFLTQPADSRQVEPPGPPPFRGGQYPSQYDLEYRFRNVNGENTRGFGSLNGPITAYRVRNGQLEVKAGGAPYPLADDGSGYYKVTSIAPEFAIAEITAFILTPAPWNPDNAGDPPPITPPTYSTGASILMALDPPTVGEISSPPPALISQSGDPLYDAARVPLQRVMDGTEPPWKRQENPVAKLPGVKTVPPVPATPANIPQPDVAPRPAKDDKPINPYPFFDPVVFPDTTTPNIFDIPPAFTPRPLTVKPLVVEPLRPTTDSPTPDPITIPTSYPAPVPSTGTPFAPNPTTRNPEPAPKTQTPVKTEPAPEKSPIEKLSDTFLPIARSIQTQTSPENIIPLVKEGTCQSLAGGCSTGVNINQQVTNAANSSAAGHALLQAADLAALKVINDKLGSQIPNGGIGGKLSRFVNFAVADRVMNLATFMVTVHNAMMLSNDIGQTLFSILDNIGNTGNLIKHPDGDSNINSQEWISSNLDSLFSSWFGAAQWTAIKAAYKNANNIHSTSSNMFDNLRSIHNDSQELLNMVRKDTAELGNALVEEGVISEDNWDPRDPSVKLKSQSLSRLQRMNEGLEALDNSLQAIEMMTATVLSVAQSAKEVKDNVSALTNQLSSANETFKTARNAAIDALPDSNFDIDDLF